MWRNRPLGRRFTGTSGLSGYGQAGDELVAPVVHRLDAQHGGDIVASEGPDVGIVTEVEDVGEPPGCRCGEVLRAVIDPTECALFRRVCTPRNPVGPCMVSAEGSCAAHYKYGEME